MEVIIKNMPDRRLKYFDIRAKYGMKAMEVQVSATKTMRECGRMANHIKGMNSDKAERFKAFVVSASELSESAESLILVTKEFLNDVLADMENYEVALKLDTIDLLRQTLEAKENQLNNLINDFRTNKKAS